MTTLIERTLQSRRIIFQTGVIATLIALGVNLVSSWLSEHFRNNIGLSLLCGILFVSIGFLYFTRELLADRTQVLNVDGLILLDPIEKELVSVSGYELSERLRENLYAVFLENRALKLSWEREMFPVSGLAKQDKNEENDKKGASDDTAVSYAAVVKMQTSYDESVADTKILIETVEFIFLKYLGLHLSSYFDSQEHDSKEVQLFERANIPQMVLANRILSLLTTPIEDRQIFSTSGMDKHPPKGEIHSIYASNGARYEKFHLSLPANTKISRPSDGTLILDHPRFQMKFQAKYRGMATVLPLYFEDLYVSHSLSKFNARNIKISLSATLRPLAFVHLNGWLYYRWIDSFFEYIQSKTDFKIFLERINWPARAAAIRSEFILDHRRKAKTAEVMSKKKAPCGEQATEQSD